MLIFNIDLFAQNKIIGSYRDHLGSHVQLNMDNTFKYTWNFDMAVSWTKGTWKLNGDTICFHMIPINLSTKYTLLAFTKLLLATVKVYLPTGEVIPTGIVASMPLRASTAKRALSDVIV